MFERSAVQFSLVIRALLRRKTFTDLSKLLEVANDRMLVQFLSRLRYATRSHELFDSPPMPLLYSPIPRQLFYTNDEPTRTLRATYTSLF